MRLAGRRYRLADGTGLDAGDSAACHGAPTRRQARVNSASRARQYERALDLWRGDVASRRRAARGHPAAAEAARRRGDVVLRFARVAGAVGAHERLMPHLRDMCAREPFNEQAHACLMTALAATGQQAAAVMLFGELRHRLDRELGLRPQLARSVCRRTDGDPQSVVHRFDRCYVLKQVSGPCE